MSSKDNAKPHRKYFDLGVSPHHDERVATQMAREAFSRERYEFLLRAIFGVMALLGVSIALNIFLASRPERIRYFATSPEGGISEVVPLDRPIQSTEEVLVWGVGEITKAFTLSFANYQQQLNEYRLDFTDLGWNAFQDALKRQKLLDTVITQQLVTTAVPQGAPVVLSQGITEGGRYGWKIQFPMQMTFESASGRNSQPVNIEAVVVRRPESENPRGLGIAQIVAK